MRENKDFDGNRIPLSEDLAELIGPHFFYRTKRPAFDPGDVAVVTAAVQQLARQRSLHCGQIELSHRAELADISADTAQAFQRLCDALGLQSPDRPSLLFCQWAPPHVDETYEGKAFVSAVLHTGEHPYVMQTLALRELQSIPRVPELTTNTRVLATGDTFVFDPCTPHYTAPMFPHERQLLILLQGEVSDKTDAERQSLLQRYPVHPQDRNQDDVFSGKTY